MPRVTMTLEEHLSDARSDEVAYRLKVANLGPLAVRLLTLNPRIPEGVYLVEVKDSSSEAVKVRHQKLCAELTQLVEDHLFLSSKEVQERVLQIAKDHVKLMLQDLPGIWRPYLNMLTGVLNRQIEQQRAKQSALNFAIEGMSDAAIALDKWFRDADDAKDTIREMFRAKCEQLKHLEHALGSDTSTTAMATIEPESFFATTYVLRFRRSAINPKQFNFAVEASFSEGDKAEIHLDGATTSVVISPRPYVLSLVTIGSALLGVALKFSLDINAAKDFPNFFSTLGNSLITGPGISAVILALLIFNIYEYTDLGKSIKLGVGWRSALLIGILCGLFSERMVNALKVLVGT